MEVAVQDDATFLYVNYGEAARDSAYAQLRNLGASRLRMNILWFQTMPSAQARSRTKPATINYDWSKWDTAIARAKAYGIKVHFNLTGDPPVWACGNKKPPGVCDGYKPNTKAFQQFTQAAAKHFGRKVDRYSIWNEPNWYSWLRPHKNAPLLYRELYRAGYNGVKKGNRRAKVLMGETAPYFQKGRAQAPLEFLREMVCVNRKFKKVSSKCKGGPLKLDGYAHHPYDFTVAPTKKRPGADNVTMANLPALISTLDAMRAKRLIKPSVKKTPIYLTEHGYFVKGPRRLPESRRAKYTVKSYDMAQKNTRIFSQLYYVFISPPADSPSAFFDLGLIETGGKPRRTYNKLRAWVKKAAGSGKVAKPGRCTAC